MRAIYAKPIIKKMNTFNEIKKKKDKTRVMKQ